MRNIIPLIKLSHNIGIDAGDNIMNVLLAQHHILPATRVISFILPELDEEYYIGIVMGNNTLSSDNVLLEKIHIKCNDKVLFIKIIFDMYFLILDIDSKIGPIYRNILVYAMDCSTVIVPIDSNMLYMCKLKFDIIQAIKIIRKKIKLGHIALSQEASELLNNKLTKICNDIDMHPSQKLLDIKNNLKTKFFID